MAYPTITHIAWAKRNRSRYNLALSSVLAPPPEVLGLAAGSFPPPVELDGGGEGSEAVPWYLADVDLGDPELERRLGERYGVDPGRVVPTAGASEANLLLHMLLRENGGGALCESPGYGAHPAVARVFPGPVHSLPRDAQGRIDLDVLRSAAGVRVIVVSDPQNPTGAPLDPSDVEALVAWAEAHDAHLVVDEVFREADPTRHPGSWATFSPRIWSMSSLTKGMGLGPIRLGWILAPPDRANDVRRVQDYTTVHPSSAAIVIGRRVIERAHAARAWILAALEPNRIRLAEDLGFRTAGTTAFLQVPGLEDTTALCESWFEELETAVVPGAFFGAPAGFRVGFGATAADFEAGWMRIRNDLAKRGLGLARYGRAHSTEDDASSTLRGARGFG